jgi:hypothetical protein
MFEYHGWVNVSTDPAEDDEDALDAVAEQVTQRAAEVDDDTGLVDARWINGTFQVHIAGLPNHRSSADDVVDLFRWIGSVAPGSYGLLYYWDDEDPRGADHRNQFEVLVMTRGKVAEHPDGYLSPCMPTIEDA